MGYTYDRQTGVHTFRPDNGPRMECATISPFSQGSIVRNVRWLQYLGWLEQYISSDKYIGYIRDS